jgi:hypothetical protein
MLWLSPRGISKFMAPWKNDALVLYHGCTEHSLRPQNSTGMATGSAQHYISRTVGGIRTEFGKGFYATTWSHQAKFWANRQARKLWVRAKGISSPRAVVLRFEVSRDALADLECLVFTNEQSGGFWRFVSYCRGGNTPHGRTIPGRSAYDVVYGPVSIWPQQLVIKDCDQPAIHISEHNNGDNRSYQYGVACRS